MLTLWIIDEAERSSAHLQMVRPCIQQMFTSVFDRRIAMMKMMSYLIEYSKEQLTFT
jgi:hypothetical protein